MSRLFTDTNAKSEALFISLMREAPAWRKLAMVDQLNQTVRSLALNRAPQTPSSCEPRGAQVAVGGVTLGTELVNQIRVRSGKQEIQRDP